MSKINEMIVSTTNTIEGVEILHYFKPVSSHVILGSNIFNEFIGGITDIFGGNSATFEKQFQTIFNDSIQKLKYAAFDIGANAIIGLKIDVGEITGKGKSMFMVTAVGTAVKVLYENKIEKVPNGEKSIDHISCESLNTLRTKKMYLEKASNGTLHLNTEVWGFLIMNQVYEIFDYIERLHEKVIRDDVTYRGTLEKFNGHFDSFISSIPYDIAISKVYPVLKDCNVKFYDLLLKIIENQKLFHYESCLVLINSQDFEIQKRGLNVSSIDQKYYSYSDIEKLQNLISKIQGSFGVKVQKTTKKDFLSGKEKEYWLCVCGKSNAVDNLNCTCGKDIYGFYAKEKKPQYFISKLEEKINLITELLKS